MQPSLFIREGFSDLDELPRSLEPMFSGVDIKRKTYAESTHTKDYCIRQILVEPRLWDLRCWKKHKQEYTKQEVAGHLMQWINDETDGLWTNNCGHCLYCIEKLLREYHLSIEEIAELAFINNNITYLNEIGNWNEGFAE